MIQEQDTITISANGKPYTVPRASTIADVLQSFQIHPQQVVVQMDGTILARSAFATTTVNEGAQLEIVTMVGGG